MKNPFKSLSTKVVACPNCQKQLRVPIRPNKTLEISCPDCLVKFNLQFKNPLSDLFTWYRGKGLLYNLKSLKYRYKLLSFGLRFRIFIIAMLFAYVLIGPFFSQSNQKELEPVKKEDPYSVEV